MMGAQSVLFGLVERCIGDIFLAGETFLRGKQFGQTFIQILLPMASLI